MSIRLLLVTITCLWAVSSRAAGGSGASLEEALRRAYAASPAIAAAESGLDAERSAIRSQASLEDPRIGFMRESNMNFMEQQQGPMNSLAVSQSVDFPVKYVLRARAQGARARAAEETLALARLETRSRVIAAYYELFAVGRVLDLLKAQRESLREIARTAEARYATGAAPQQDEMKAHVEQTQLERDILATEEELASARSTLEAAMGWDGDAAVTIAEGELQPPRITIDLLGLPKAIVHHSRKIGEARARAEESGTLKSLAALSYAPDFTLSYRRAIGSYANMDAYSASIEMSIPLWFLARQSGESSAATARANGDERRLEAVKLDHRSEVRSLVAKVDSGRKILETYSTGLIPQAESTLSSSRASYRAGRSGFIELLDSERSLYNVRIAYYRTLAQYAESTAKLEETVGESVSDLPFGGTQ